MVNKKYTKKISKSLIVVLSIALVLGVAGYVRSASSVDLDTASGFAVLAGAAISDTAVASNITGDVGLSPTGGTAITQLSCTNVTGTIYDTNGGYAGGYNANTGCLVTNAALLIAAKADASLAYNNAKTQPQNFAVNASTTDSFAGTGYVLAPGVYRSGSTMGVPANLTLNGGGNPNAVFIFQAGSTLNTVLNSTISLTNGAQAGNVFWQVGSSATLGTGSTFKGTIMAAVSITDNGGSTIHGRLLADADNTDADSTGAVTLNNTTVIVPTTLHVVKTVVNDNGGTAVAADFNLHVKLSGIDVVGSPAVGTVAPGTSYSLSAGTYVVSEDANASYTKSFSGDCDASGNIIISSGDDKTCTITNDDIAPAPATLNVVKTVVNDNGGTASASAWMLTVASSNGGTGTGSAIGTGTPGTAYTLQTGKAYSVAESGGPSGYSSSSSSDCTIASVVSGVTYTCTITNDDIAPDLHLRKVVVNDNGGTALNTAWTLTATGTGGSPTNVTGTTPVDSGATFKADTYTLAESVGPSGYTASAWVCTGGVQVGSAVTIALGESVTCTITNNDIVPGVATLNVVKTVVNDNGGTASASAWMLTVASSNGGTGTGSAIGTGTPGTAYTLQTGKAYSVAESGGPSGYSSSSSSDCTIASAAASTAYTCTIINDDIAPQLIANKVVINDNGRTKVISDFPLFIDGGSVASGVASTTTIGLHTVSETSDSGYTATIGGNCAADGTITLALGDVKTCTVTNDDITPVVSPPSGGGGGGDKWYYPPVPPLIDVVKVPSPLVLPDGPGTVKYTYTLRNIGTVSVNNVTMVGDTCSPITLISGDTDVDAMLDVNETWVYTCSTTLSKTHTNIVTAIGWANGISATDIANATVIVGVPAVPPLIHVTKVPNPLVLSAGGGKVTYTNKVTNPGTVALSNIRLTDDKCASVKYISGDTNGNSKLDTTETWTYTCLANLTKTTVNTVTASGDANGLTARDFAIVTVVVTNIPKLPNTGLPSSENTTPWNSIVPAGIFGALFFLYFARRKQTA